MYNITPSITTIIAFLLSHLTIAQVSMDAEKMVTFNFGSPDSLEQGWNQYESAHLINGIPSEIDLLNSIITASDISIDSTLSLTAHQTVQFDFGNTTSPTGWNQYSTSGLVNPVVSDTTGAVTSIGISISISDTLQNNTSNFVDGSTQGGSSDAGVYEDALTLISNGNDNFTITISGLDPLASYDIFAGGLTNDASFGAGWTIEGVEQQTNFQDTIGYINFTSLTPDSSGNIVLEIENLVNGNNNANNGAGTGVGIAELTITLIPEPSSTLLFGMGILYLSFRRDRV